MCICVYVCVCVLIIIINSVLLTPECHRTNQPRGFEPQCQRRDADSLPSIHTHGEKRPQSSRRTSTATGSPIELGNCNRRSARLITQICCFYRRQSPLVWMQSARRINTQRRDSEKLLTATRELEGTGCAVERKRKTRNRSRLEGHGISLLLFSSIEGTGGRDRFCGGGEQLPASRGIRGNGAPSFVTVPQFQFDTFRV